MREILFRAKRIDNGEWVEGLPQKIWGDWHIINSDDENTAYPIDPETLCQFTGLMDKNGKQIWENDIIKHEISDTIGAVKWYEEDYVGWCVDDVVIDEQHFTVEMWSECKVVGNFFDDKDLLDEVDY